MEHSYRNSILQMQIKGKDGNDQFLIESLHRISDFLTGEYFRMQKKLLWKSSESWIVRYFHCRNKDKTFEFHFKFSFLFLEKNVK